MPTALHPMRLITQAPDIVLVRWATVHNATGQPGPNIEEVRTLEGWPYPSGGPPKPVGYGPAPLQFDAVYASDVRQPSYNTASKLPELGDIAIDGDTLRIVVPGVGDIDLSLTSEVYEIVGGPPNITVKKRSDGTLYVLHANPVVKVQDGQIQVITTVG